MAPALFRNRAARRAHARATIGKPASDPGPVPHISGTALSIDDRLAFRLIPAVAGRRPPKIRPSCLERTT
jgi:hypothetical protein